jgi:lysophospholipase L1-like esterase
MPKTNRSSNFLGQAAKPIPGLALLTAVAWFGLAGCGGSGNSAQTGNGGQASGGKISSGGQPGQGGQTGSGGQGGQTGQGGSTVGTGGKSTAGATGGTSVIAGNSGGGQTSSGGTSGKGGTATGGSGTAGTTSTGGGSGGGTGGMTGAGGSSSGTGGAGTGGGATGGSSQGGTTKDGGQGGTVGGDAAVDASIDRAPDTAALPPDAGPAFAPCPSDGTACKIMPLGDSITDGVGSSGGGYRVELFKQTITNSQLITFVGRNLNGPTSVTVSGQTKTFPRNHEGYSGYTIDSGGGRTGISTLVDAGISANMPHIVLLMIGTNDVNISLDLTNASTRLGALLDRISKDAPKALIVIAKIVPTTNDTTNTRVRTYNDAIPGLVQTRAAAGGHIVMVDMYTAFTSNTSYKTAIMSDELHPNDAGYVVMAQTWYAAIKSYLR